MAGRGVQLARTVVALKAASESTSTGSRAHGLCPFKGLATFEFDDAGYFFGRERAVAELVARLVGAPLLGVGPGGQVLAARRAPAPRGLPGARRRARPGWR